MGRRGLIATGGRESDGCRGRETHRSVFRAEARLREAAHKLCGMVAAFSSVAAAVASDLEDQAAGDRLEECRPLVEQVESIARELLDQVGVLSIEDLRHLAVAGGEAGPAAER